MVLTVYTDNNGGKSEVDGDDGNTFEDWHTYEIDWQHDYINWSVDGDVKRTLKKEDTWNETAQRFEFPQTPSRMQMSLWPAGQSSNAQGTIDWAGGEIDWDSEDIKEAGYYYAKVGEINVECYDAPDGADIQGGKSYIFKDDKGLNNSVQVTNNDTMIASFGANGLHPDIGKNKSSSSNSSTTTTTAGTVPTSSGGTGNEPGSHEGSGQGNQENSNKNTTSNGASSRSERVMQGSFFGVLVAIVVMITM